MKKIIIFLFLTTSLSAIIISMGKLTELLGTEYEGSIGLLMVGMGAGLYGYHCEREEYIKNLKKKLKDEEGINDLM